MATYDRTTGQGTAGHPSRQRGVYVVERTVSIAQVVSDAGANLSNGDILQMIDVPAETVVIYAGAEVLTAVTGTTVTFDVGLLSSAAADVFIDGASTTAGVKALAQPVAGAAEHQILNATADTLDITLISGANDMSAGVIRVWAILADVSGINETDPDVAVTF